MPELPKRGLGKGLNALIRTPSSVSITPPSHPAPSSPTPAVDPVTGEQILRVSLDQIVPSPFQPRKRFNDEHLEELAESIREHGLIQPLVVRPVNGKYELIAGERRWRACTKLQLENVPIVTRSATDKEVLEMALIENLQREDLDPIEEAEAYSRLAVEFGLKQEEIAKQVSKSRSDVSNTMRLLDLDRDVQLLVSQKHISRGHAKALLGVKNRPEQKMLADIVIRKKLTVRDTETLVQEYVHGKSTTKPKSDSDTGIPDKEDSYLKFVEDKLRGRYSTNVIINHKEKKGKIEIEYYGNEDLSRVLELMGVSLD
ncbi:MAG: ParB/RepB/Spo0J family partition protein [Verrucomicrobiales bacterium]|nr:ParB/RepB/Spo0J family partition protein [Verrucomicrobiales bacterium]